MIRFQFLSVIASVAIGVGLLHPQVASAQNNVQTVVVRNATFGTPVPFAQVNVTDGRACYATVLTNAQGQATFRTNGIATIQVRHPSYGAVTVSPNASAMTYTVSMKPLPARPQNTSLGRTNVIAGHVLPLAQAMGGVQYLGRTSLRNIELTLNGLAAGTFVTCEIIIPATGGTASPACVSAAFVLGAAGTATFLLDVAGVPGTTQFDFYRFGNTVIALPAR